MFNYQDHLDSINPEAYHAGEFQWEEDGYTVTRTHHYSAPGCHNSCGILIYTKDGKVEKVEGDPLEPYNGGKLCMRCLDLVEAINNPMRLKWPVKRAGERGENKWDRISWDEAYQIIADKVREIWATHGGEAIMGMHGTGRNTVWQMPLITHGCLKTANEHGVLSGQSCYVPRITACVGISGDYMIADASEAHPDRYNNPDWKCPEVIVVWGNEPLASNGDGYLGHWLNLCVQMGAKIISVDPRLTWWGARADYHLQLRPGTDAAIACAWLQVITSEDLVDHEFIDLWCYGYDQLVESVKDMTPEWAAEISGVDAEDIRGAARLYATAKPATFQWGLSNDQQQAIIPLNLAHVDLMAITGNLDRPGGNILVHNAFETNASYSSFEDHVPAETRARKINTRRGLGIDATDLTACATPDGSLHILETFKDEMGEDYPIDMIWIQGANPISCTGQDTARWREAMLRVPFIVVFDPFITPTASAVADIVLPAAMSAERNSARSWWFPLRTTYKTSQYYEAKTDEQVAAELGMILDPDLFENTLGITDDISFCQWFLDGGDGVRQGASRDNDSTNTAIGGVGKSFQEFCEEGGYAYDDWNDKYEKYAKGMLRDDGSLGFGTPTGRVELCPTMFPTWGFASTPYYVEPPYSPISTPELMEEYPLVMTTGGRSYEFFHSENRQLPTMREFHPLPKVSINPADVEKYGLVDGQWAWIENEHGRFRQIVKATPSLPEGTIHAEHGWWFPEGEGAEPSLFGTYDSNPNNCIPALMLGEGGIGAPVKCTICKVYPYEEGDMLPGEFITRHGGWKDYIPGVVAGDKRHAAKVMAEKEA